MELPKPYHPGFVRWLRECYDRGGLHGSILVDRNIEHVAGRWATNPSDADDDLSKAEALGWITRGKLSPTVSQAAFLGLAYRNHIPPIHASCWYFDALFAQTPERRAALDWLKEREATLFGITRCSLPMCHVLVKTAGDRCERTDARHV